MPFPSLPTHTHSHTHIYFIVYHLPNKKKKKPKESNRKYDAGEKEANARLSGALSSRRLHLSPSIKRIMDNFSFIRQSLSAKASIICHTCVFLLLILHPFQHRAHRSLDTALVHFTVCDFTLRFQCPFRMWERHCTGEIVIDAGVHILSSYKYRVSTVSAPALRSIDHKFHFDSLLSFCSTLAGSRQSGRRSRSTQYTHTSHINGVFALPGAVHSAHPFQPT